MLRATQIFSVQLIDWDGKYPNCSRPHASAGEHWHAQRRVEPFCAIIHYKGVRVAPRISRGRTAADQHPRSPPKRCPLESMRNLWLTFAQTATVAVGVLFVVTTLKPEWLGRPRSPPPAVALLPAASSSH